MVTLELGALGIALATSTNGLTATLDDPALYTTPDGTQRAGALGKELDEAKSNLDAAILEWERASQEVDESVE